MRHDALPAMNSMPAPRRINNLGKIEINSSQRGMIRAVVSFPPLVFSKFGETAASYSIRIYSRVRGTGYFCPKQKGR